MTDYDGPPLTRRERKERERALAEATGQVQPVEAPIAEEPVVEDAATEQPTTDDAATTEPESVDESEETQAIDVSELIADLKPQSTPAPDAAVAGVPAAGEAKVQEAREADAAAETEVESEPQAEGASAGFGRFFGRRGPKPSESSEGAESSSTDEPEPASVDDIIADLQPEPTTPTRAPLQRIEVDDLDTVDDAEVDRLEIDEVDVADARVSSRRIADSTPAELEDRRVVAADDETDEVEPVRQGPSRTGRMPVIVNVVEDTSSHHIADLRGETSAISASSVGTGTSTITANALVLPASGANEPITVETADGVIVTGSIDLPDGFASSGRSRGSIDVDVDGADDVGEVRSPETQPVRASRAVSSYANARVRIAPERRSRNAAPIVIGVAGGLGIVAIGTAVVAFLSGWIGI